MGIDGSCKLFLKAKSEDVAKKFYDDVKSACKSTGCGEDHFDVSQNGCIVEVKSGNDRSFFLQRWVFSILLGRKKVNVSWGTDWEEWGENFADVSRKYNAALEVWASYDSSMSEDQHGVYYNGKTLIEESRPFCLIADMKHATEDEIEEEAFYEKMLPNFNNYGKMTI